MTAVEDVQYTKDYFDPEKRAFANAVQVFFTDGTKTDKVEVAFPLGHRRRRAEGIPLLEEKFLANARTRFDAAAVDAMFALMKDQKKLETTPVASFMDLLVTRFAEKKTGTR
jgi:2-methylcitrate dehydratase